MAVVSAISRVHHGAVGGSNLAPSLQVLGANERIGVAIVGVTWRCDALGQNHLMGIQQNSKENNTRLVAACDVFTKQRNWAAQVANLTQSQLYVDYRKLLERTDVDAVVIATDVPLHAVIAIDALDAGKHVYCEQPFTRYFNEAFEVQDKVKTTGKVFQLGAQSCSAGAWKKCAEVIGAGLVGKPIWGQGYYCRNSFGGEWNYLIDPEATPQNVDWEKWLGPVKPHAPFSSEHFCRPNKYYRYSAGLLGGLASTRLHALMLAAGITQFPSRVDCISTRNVHSDLALPGTPEREVAEHVQFMAKFPDDFVVSITCSSVNANSLGFAIYGHRGTLNMASAGDFVELIPEKEFTDELEPQKWIGLQPENVRLHEKNWFDCIRSGKRPNANIDLATRAQTILALAEISARRWTTCFFDENTRRILDTNGSEISPTTYDSQEPL